MNLTEQLRGNFPKTIDKSKPIFSSLIANDNGDAAIQKQLADMLAYMNEWISTPDIYKQTGVMLEKTVSFFSFLERFAEETETSLKNRFRAIFVRNHDTKWGTPYDVKNVFRQYFPHATIYLAENVNDIKSQLPALGNLFLDGDIDTSAPSAWTLVNCQATRAARFSKSFGIELNTAGATCSQSVNIEHNSCYFLHFFLKGSIDIIVKTNDNKYWDYTNKEWSNSEKKNHFESVNWDNRSLFFITDNNSSSVTVTFQYSTETTYIDYFRLFLKQSYSSFTVIAHFEGDSAEKAFGLAGGDADPNIVTQSVTPPLPRYDNYGYYDKSFLSGVPIGFATDIYEDLLDYLRAQGVKAYLDIVTKDA